MKREWSPKTAQTPNCSFLAASIAEKFVNAPTPGWRVLREMKFYRAKEQSVSEQDKQDKTTEGCRWRLWNG